MTEPRGGKQRFAVDEVVAVHDPARQDLETRIDCTHGGVEDPYARSVAMVTARRH